jgi:hypothetical protein
MKTNYFNRFKIYRWLTGGEWYKTKYKGWLNSETFNDYLRCGFDPKLEKWETHRKKVKS